MHSPHLRVRIAHFNNVANMAFNYVLALRRHGQDATLIFERDTHEFSRPEWESPNALRERWVKPIQTLSGKAGLVGLRSASAILELSNYDFISAWDTGPIWAQWAGKPYVVHSAGGDLFAAVEGRTPRQWLLRRGYEHAKCLVYYLPYQKNAIGRLRTRRLAFARLPIDEDRYSPGPESGQFSDLRHWETLLFCPSRHNWQLKGTDVMLRAYADALRVEENINLVLVSWGSDLEKSRELCTHLGLGGHITWIPPMNKEDLIGMYRTCDVVLDQFVLGSYGMTAVESLMCGKPVVIKIEGYEDHYTDPLPFVNSHDQHDLADSIVTLAQDHSLIGVKSQESRLWALKHHSYASVSAEYLQLVSELTA